MRAPRPTGSKVAVAAAILASILWLVIWAHQRAAHGATEANEMRLVWGMTWMDSGKLLAVPPLLLLPIALRLRERAGAPSSRAGFAALAVALALFSVATFLEFAFFPWGSYARTFEQTPAAGAAGFAQALLTVALVLAALVGGVPAARAGDVRWWGVAALALGSLGTVFLTPASWVPAVAWLVVAMEEILARG